MEDANYKSLLGMMLKDLTDSANCNSVLHHQRILTLGPTPQVLIDIGMPQLPLVISGRVVDKAFFDHGMTKGLLEQLYKLIANPKAAYQGHQDQPGSAVVTYETKDGAPIIAAIHPNKQMGGRGDRAAFYNNIASVCDKRSNSPGETIEVRWKKQGLLQWQAPRRPAANDEKWGELILLKVAG